MKQKNLMTFFTKASTSGTTQAAKLDDYYYYAFCIALISIISIATTLIETKKVRSFSNGKTPLTLCCRPLVVWERCRDFPVSLSSCATSPVMLYVAHLTHDGLIRDNMWLDGSGSRGHHRFIINESMLTGDSVPVSKAAAKDESWKIEGIPLWRNEGGPDPWYND
jgi:cation-transporting ATPase 13A3/4/5